MSTAVHNTFIKICGLTLEADVLACTKAGVNAIGFVMYPLSARYVSPKRAGILAKLLPPDTTPVLLFVNASLEDVLAACQAVPNALLQFHGDESPAECERLAQAVRRPYWRAARIPADYTDSFDLVKFAHDYSNAQAILLGWRENIQLVTASSKRQRSPRFEWWIDACKCDRWHSNASVQSPVFSR